MPSSSQAQHNLMEMVAHDPKAAKRTGVPQSVGKEFAAADKGKSFGGKKRKPSNAERQAMVSALTKGGK